MKLILFMVLVVCNLFFISCKDNPKEEIARIVTEWQGKKVTFPDDMVFTLYGQDTVRYEIPESDYKILLYVDSVGCTSCKLQLHEWKGLIKEVDSLTFGTVPVLLFFHPKDKRELAYLLKRDGMDIPVCFDDEDRLNTINQFPSRDDFQCFLLDKDNKVVYIGNPIHNTRIREIYLSQIALDTHGEETVDSSPERTIVHVDQTEFDLGNLKQGEPVTVTALVHNKGNSPLIIYNTRASCGCTDIDYNKKPVLPGDTLKIKITYNAEDAGYFNRTVSIHGNMGISPIILRLKGNTN